MSELSRKQPDISINTGLARQILTSFIRSELNRMGFSKAVIGLSGGIDFGRLVFPRRRSAGTRECPRGSDALLGLFLRFARTCSTCDRSIGRTIVDHSHH